MTAWKEEVNALKYAKVGDKLTVSFNLESREYNGKWYTDIKAWKIVNGGDENSATTVTKMDTGSEPDNSLPF